VKRRLARNIPTATCLNSLASVLKAQGDFAGARPLYERALAIREKTLGPEHYDTAESLNALAVVLSNEGDFAGRGYSSSAPSR
jgi:tetratricopeptide (TPR) repeat protein